MNHSARRILIDGDTPLTEVTLNGLLLFLQQKAIIPTELIEGFNRYGKIVRRIQGIAGLAKYLQVHYNTARKLYNSGRLDAAVTSHVGKKIIFDATKVDEAIKPRRSDQSAEERRAEIYAEIKKERERLLGVSMDV